MQAARALGICFGDCEAAHSPFACHLDESDAATAQDVEIDAEFTLDLADAATEEVLNS